MAVNGTGGDMALARADAGAIAGELRGRLPDLREVLSQPLWSRFASGARALDRIAAGRDVGEIQPQALEDAWAGASLLDLQVTTAHSDGVVRLDVWRVLDNLPSGQLDDVGSQRMFGTASLLRTAQPFGSVVPERPVAKSGVVLGRPLRAEAQARQAALTGRIAAARRGDVAVQASAELGKSVAVRARDLVRRGFWPPEGTSFPDRVPDVTRTDRLAPAGTIERGRGAGNLLVAGRQVLAAAEERLRDGRLAPNDSVLGALVSELHVSVDELESNAHARALLGPGHADALLAARTDLAGVESLLSRGQSLDSIDLSGLRRLGIAAARGMDDVTKPGLDDFRAAQGALRAAADLPAGDPRRVVDALANALHVVASLDASTLTPYRRSALALELANVSRQFGRPDLQRVVLEEPARRALEQAVRRTDAMIDPNSSGSMSGALHGVGMNWLGELLRPDHAEFVEKLDAIDRFAAVETTRLTPASARRLIEAARPLAAQSPYRARILAAALRSAADGAVSTRRAELAPGIAIPEWPLLQRLDMPGRREVPGWGGRAGDEYVTALDGTGGSSALDDAAASLALGPDLARLHDYAQALRYGRAAAPAALGTAPERLREHAQALDEVLAGFDGERHQMPSLDQYVGHLTRLIEAFDDVPAPIRDTLVPTARDGALVELARAVAASRRATDAGSGVAEDLWPRRGAVGRLQADARLLADVHEQLTLDAPSLI